MRIHTGGGLKVKDLDMIDLWHSVPKLYWKLRKNLKFSSYFLVYLVEVTNSSQDFPETFCLLVNIAILLSSY